MLKFVKRIALVVGAVFIALIVIGLLLPDHKPATASHSATPEQPVAVQASTTPTRAQPKITKVTWLSASQLARAYESNEIAADKVFKGHSVAVKGRVKSIGKDILGQPYVTFSSGDESDFRSVQAFFASDQEDDLANLSSGEHLTVVCEVDGLMMNVLLKHCHIATDSEVGDPIFK